MQGQQWCRRHLLGRAAACSTAGWGAVASAVEAPLAKPVMMLMLMLLLMDVGWGALAWAVEQGLRHLILLGRRWHSPEPSAAARMLSWAGGGFE